MCIIHSFKGWIYNDINNPTWALQSTASVNLPSKGEKIISKFFLKNELTFTPKEVENKYILLEIEFKKGLDLSKEQGEVLRKCHISQRNHNIFPYINTIFIKFRHSIIGIFSDRILDCQIFSLLVVDCQTARLSDCQSVRM